MNSYKFMRESVRVPQLLSSQLESLYSSFVQSRSKNYCDIQRACDEWFNFYKGKADFADLESLFSIKDDFRNKIESLQVKKFTMYVNDVYQEFKQTQPEFGNLDSLVNLVDFIVDFYEKNFVYETNNIYAYYESKVNSYVVLSFYYTKIKNIVDFAKIAIENGRRQKSIISERNYSNVSSNVAFSLELQNIGQIGNRVITETNDDIVNIGDSHVSIERYNGTFESNITLTKLKALGVKEADSKEEPFDNGAGYDFLRKTCENLEMDKQNLETVLDKLKSDYKKLKLEYTELKHIRNTQVKKIESLTLEVQEYKDENRTLKDQINNVNTRMCNLFCETQELKDIKTEFIELETKYSIELIQGRNRIDAAVEAVKLLTEQEKEALMQSHQKDLKRCNQIIDNLENRLEAELQKVRLVYEEKMDMMTRDHNKSLNKLRTEVCMLTSENENLKNQLEAASKSRLAESNQTNVFMKTIAELESDLKTKEAQIIGSYQPNKISQDKQLQTSFHDETNRDNKEWPKPNKMILEKLKHNYLTYISSTAKKTMKNASNLKSKSENKSMTHSINVNLVDNAINKPIDEITEKDITIRAQSLRKLNKEINTMKQVIKSINKQVSLKHLKGKNKMPLININPEESCRHFIKKYSVVCTVKRSNNNPHLHTKQ